MSSPEHSRCFFDFPSYVVTPISADSGTLSYGSRAYLDTVKSLVSGYRPFDQFKSFENLDADDCSGSNSVSTKCDIANTENGGEVSVRLVLLRHWNSSVRKVFAGTKNTTELSWGLFTPSPDTRHRNVGPKTIGTGRLERCCCRREQPPYTVVP